MAFFKCKMCGGEITFTPGNSVETCDYCGTVQTMPKVVDEGLQGLFNRANVLRMKAEFDRAAEIYEKILQASETEAEAYWGLILCKYGVEYVEDPTTYKRVPTCHRASYDAVVTDEDYKMAVQYADTTQKSIYEAEAKQIDEIQKGIVALAEKEAPYDVFICYKETDENGKRTQDSVIANDIYYQLTQEGFKVFYAAITLEDKLGKEYEPYIFSALNSAKVLLAIGTKPEYFYAVWVKNEWSRFLKIMKKDRSRILIPCFRDMDAYELPEEFAHLQAQDMSKIGFINDLVRGIKKVIATESEPVAVVKETTIVQPTLSSNLVSLIKRGNMALEDGEWEKADGFFEEVLNQDAECAEAYLGKLLVKYECGNTKEYIEYYLEKTSDAKTAKKAACNEETSHIEEMCQKYCVDKYLSSAVIEPLYKFDRNYASELSCRMQQKEENIEEILGEKHYVRAKQYAQGDFLSELNQIVEMIIKKLDERICEAEKADSEAIAQIQDNYQKHIAEADAKALELYEKACAKRESDYQNYVHNYSVASNIAAYEAAKEKFQMMDGYKDSADYIGKCNENIERLRQEQKDAAELRKKEAERRKRRNVRIASIISACAVLACVAYYYIIYKYIPEKNIMLRLYICKMSSLRMQLENLNFWEITRIPMK